MFRTPRYIIASLFFHALVLFLMGSLLLRPISPLAPVGETVVELTSIPPASPTAASGRSASGSGSGKVTGRQLKLSDLGLQGQGYSGIPQDESDKEEEDRLEVKHTATASLLRTRKAVLYDRLQDRIDAALAYPKEFGDAKIEGTVEAHFVFDEEGRWNEKRSRIVASSRYLKVYIAQLARHCFKEPISKNYLRGKDSFALECLFIFSLTGEGFMGVGQAAPEGANLSGKLTFFRSNKPFGAWKVGPINGYGVAPAVGIDPTWVYDQISDVVNPKAKEDPLEKYRRDSAW